MSKVEVTDKIEVLRRDNCILVCPETTCTFRIDKRMAEALSAALVIAANDIHISAPGDSDLDDVILRTADV